MKKEIKRHLQGDMKMFKKEAAEDKKLLKKMAKKPKKKHSEKKESKGEKKIEKVMREYKGGKLHSGSKKGPKVKSRKQAIAIALSEARRGKKK